MSDWLPKLNNSGYSAPSLGSGQNTKDEFEYEPDTIIISLKPSINPDGQEIKNLISKYKIKEFKRLFPESKPKRKPIAPLPDLSRFHKIRLSKGSNLATIMEELRKLPFIESAEPNYKIKLETTTPNDPFFQSQSNLININVPQAWDIQRGSSNITIAFIGTGVDYNHEDLRNRIWRNPGEIEDGIDNDGNGYIDDIVGWNFENNNNNPIDLRDHETGVASVAATETNNSIGMAGVDWYAKIMALRTYYLDQCSVAIDYATNNGAHIINMSWSINYDVSYLRNSILYAYSHGLILVASAGNYGNDEKRYPASYSEVISAFDVGWSGSNYGPGVDLSAPSYANTVAKAGGGYGSSYGTSYSAPLIAGLAALILAQAPNLTPAQVMAVIRNSAIDLQTPGWDYKTGWGKVDAYAALRDMNTYVYPDARIFFPKPNGYFQTEPINIMGKATSPNFSHYIIEWGWGANPTEWYTDNVILENNGLSPVEDGKLGSITFNATNLVTLRLKVFDQNLNYSISTVIIQVDNTVNEGWTINLSDSLSQVATGDVNGDGFDEIFAITRNPGIYPTNRIYGLNGQGNYLNGWPRTYNFSNIAMGDINDDLNSEIVGPVWSYNAANDDIYVLKNDGTIYPGWPQLMNETTYEAGSQVPPSLADINNNNKLEIIQGTWHLTNLNGQIYIWNEDGTLFPGWPITFGRVLTQAVGDVNNDNQKEIVVGENNKQIFVLNINGAPLPNWPISIPYYPRKLVLGKIDNNSFSKIGVMTYDDIHLFDLNGNELPGWPKNVGGDEIVLGDLNHDQNLEIVAVSGGKVYIWDYAGNLFPNWPQGAGLSRVLLADITGDGNPDIISWGSNQLIAWNLDGTTINGFPKTINAISDVTICDLEKDGKTNLIVAASDGYLYNFNLNAPYNSLNNPWPVNFHDRHRTSNYDTDIIDPIINHTPVLQAEVNTSIPIVASIIDNTGIRSAKTYYKNSSSSIYSAIQMTNSEGNLWQGSIPSSVVRLNGVQYYLVAHDTNLNSTISPLGVPTNVYNVTVVDTTAPTINHTPITSADEGQPLTISAQVTDNSGNYPTVVLYYRSSGQVNWNTITMTRTNNNYSATIPGSYITIAGLDYYIEAKDQSNNISTTPDNAPANFYQVTVNDRTPPTITHTPIASAYLRRNIDISAEISDNVGVTEANLHFRASGQSSWQITTMLPSGNIYLGTIPGSIANLPSINYYLSAKDGNNNITYSPNNAPNVYYSVSVVDNIPPASPTNISAFSSEDRAIPLSWDSPTVDEDGGPLSGLAGYIVAYRDLTNNGSWQEIDVGNTLNYIITNLTNDHIYELKVRAYDNTNPPNLSPWSETILAQPKDIIPPTIIHNPVTSAEIARDINISAQVIDNSEIKNARLYFKSTSSANYQIIQMSKMGNNYFATIPASFVTLDGIQYYLEAEDTSNNITTLPINAPTNVYNITVIDTLGPRIEHQPPEELEFGNDLTLRVKIEDETPLTQAQICSASSCLDLLPVAEPTYETTITAQDIRYLAQGAPFNYYLAYYFKAQDTSGNAAQSPVYKIKLTDTQSPTILHNPNTDYSFQEDLLNITADITDNHLVKEARVFCKRADQTQGWQTKVMIGGPLYAGTCNTKELENPLGIDYFLTASDVHDNTSTTPTYFIPSQILKDTTPPQITHQPVEKTLEKVDLLIYANITDDLSGVETAEVYYQHENSSTWKLVTMNKQENTYSATIPAEDVIPDQIKYYISATDKRGNKNKTQTYTIKVERYVPSSGCGCSMVR